MARCLERSPDQALPAVLAIGLVPVRQAGVIVRVGLERVALGVLDRVNG